MTIPTTSLPAAGIRIPGLGGAVPRSVLAYAAIGILAGIDLLLFGPWIAAMAIDAAALPSTPDLQTYAAVLGVFSILFGLAVALVGRRGGDRAGLAPVMAGIAGLLCLGAAAAGASILPPFGIGLLVAFALTDFLFLVLMRRSLSA
ncbi:MAG: hypothetical protein RLY86_3083 [Pseudomonadota bacterium]|jgi:hypothetical protein